MAGYFKDEVGELRANEEKVRETETSLRTEVDEVVRSKRELENKVEELIANLKEAEKTKTALKGEVDKQDAELEKVKRLKEDLESRQKMFKKEQKNKVAELTQKVKTLEASKVAAEKELREAKQLNLQMTQEREVLSREKAQLKKENSQSKTDLQTLEDAKTELNTMLTEAGKLLKDAESKLEERNKENEELSRNLDGLQKAKTFIEEELHKVETERDSALENARKLEAKLATEIDTVKVSEEKWRKSQHLFSKEKKTLVNHCSRMEEKLKEEERMKDQAIQELEEMKGKADALEREKEALEPRSKEEEEKLRAAEKEKTKLNAKLSEAEKSLERELLKCRETMEEMKVQNARLQETLDHDSLFGELRDDWVKLSNDMKKDVKKNMEKIHEELSNSQVLQNENFSLKVKLAEKSGELNQARRELSDVVQHDRAKSKQKEELLMESLGGIKKHQDEMKQELLQLFKKQQDDDVEKEKLLATVEDLTKQLEKENKQLESTQNEMEEMSRKHALALTERDSTESNLQNALTFERETVANLQNEVAQLKRCLEEVSQEHNFKQSQSSKLVRDMKEMMSQLIKQRDERISMEMEEELRNENARLQEDLRETQSVLREREKESARAMMLQEKHAKFLTFEVHSLAGVPHLDSGDKDEALDKEKLLGQFEDLQKQLKEKEELNKTSSKLTEMSQEGKVDTCTIVEHEELREQLSCKETELSELRIEHDRLREQYERKREENYKFEDKQMELLQRIEELERTTNPKLPAKVGAHQLAEPNVPPSLSEELSQKLAQSKECIKALENMSTNLILLEKPSEEDVEQISSDIHSADAVETVVPGPLAHETELKKLCWIPFGIQTLTVGQEGGLFPLQPQSKELSEDRDVIMLEVPENAVNTAVCDKLCIRYGVIVYGPFDVPEGYQLGSMAVYVYFEEDHTVKPVLLHLPHWSGKDGESSLKCAIAPHRLEEGEEKYKFRLTEDGDFQSTEGSGVIAIDGHCSLFAKVLKQKASLQYYATGLEKEVKDGVNLYVLITYASQVWLQILERYRSATSSSEFVLFEFDDKFIRGSVTPEGGSGWEAHVNVNDVVGRQDVEYKSHGIEDVSDMEGAVKRRAYPPFISCQTTYSKEVKKTGEPTKAVLAIEGAKDRVLKFLCTAYQNKSAECKSPVLQSVSSSPTSPGHRPLSPSKDFTVQNLMPYIRKLAPSGQQIAGYLDRTDDWDNIVLSHQDPEDRLQELLKRWLADSEDEKCPHSWDGFISIVKAIGVGKLAEKIISEVHQDPTTNEGK